MRIPLRHARLAITLCALVAAIAIEARDQRTAYAADGLSLQLLASVNKPVAIVNAHDGSNRLFIVDQEGVIRIWTGTQILPTPFLDISTPVLCCNEQGLLGLA